MIQFGNSDMTVLQAQAMLNEPISLKVFIDLIGGIDSDSEFCFQYENIVVSAYDPSQYVIKTGMGFCGADVLQSQLDALSKSLNEDAIVCLDSLRPASRLELAEFLEDKFNSY